MFTKENITLQKEKDQFIIATKKRKTPKLYFRFKKHKELLHVSVVKVGAANLDEYFTKEDLVKTLKEIERTYPTLSISYDFNMIWNKASVSMIKESFKELDYFHISHLQNILLNALSGKANGSNYVKLKHERFKKLFTDQRQKNAALEKVHRLYPTFEYQEVEYNRTKLIIMYYLEGSRNDLTISYDAEQDHYHFLTNGNEGVQGNHHDLYELITVFFQKEYEKNRIKSIYKPPTYHFDDAFDEQGKNGKKRIYTILQTIFSPAQIEELIAKNKQNITKNTFGKLRIFTIGDYYLFLKGDEDKLFTPKEKKEAKIYYEEFMKQQTKELWQKIQDDKKEKAS